VSQARRSGTRAHWRSGWWQPACAVASPNFGARPPGVLPSLVVVHSISLPPGHWRGDAVQRLFTNTLNHDAHPYYAGLRGLEVSAHFFIRRGGQVMQFVSCDARAWHAGQSSWRGRANCNEYSIGIELEGLEGGRFEAAQYRALKRLLRACREAYPGLQDVAGHEHVAPGRKADPGPGFDWARLARGLRSTTFFVHPRAPKPRLAQGISVRL
jgi:N-acetyl-anhydromuramoyl-L-alanine amidase